MMDLQSAKDLRVPERRALILVKQPLCSRNTESHSMLIFLWGTPYNFQFLASVNWRSEMSSNLTNVSQLASGISKICTHDSNATIHAHSLHWAVSWNKPVILVWNPALPLFFNTPGTLPFSLSLLIWESEWQYYIFLILERIIWDNVLKVLCKL